MAGVRMAGGTPCRGYDPVRRTTGRTGLSDRPERRRAGFGDDEFHPGELPGGGNFRCRNAGGVENRFRFWPGGGVLRVSWVLFVRAGGFARISGASPGYSTKKDPGIRLGHCDFLSGSVAFARKFVTFVRAFGRFRFSFAENRAGWVFRMVLRSAVLCTLFNPI